MADSGGFINRRTGKYVSSMRAHQHVGESIAGYEKARSGSTGNFYMRPTSSNSFFGSSNPYASIAESMLEIQAMRMYADAMNSIVSSLNESTFKSQLEAEDQSIKEACITAMNTLSRFDAIRNLADDPEALLSLQLLIPCDQMELFATVGSLENLKESCSLVQRVIEMSSSRVLELRRIKDSFTTNYSEKEAAKEAYELIQSLRSRRNEAFKSMQDLPSGASNHKSAILTFWQAIDEELEIIDKDAWIRRKFKEACLLIDYGAFEQAKEMLECLAGYPGVEEKLTYVRNALADLEKQKAYNEAQAMLDACEFQQAIKAFTSLGDWRDAPERIEDAKVKMWRWQKDYYHGAIADFNNGRYAESRDRFERLGYYLDSHNRMAVSADFATRLEKYERAEAFEQRGLYAKAREQFRRIATFKDAEARAIACNEKVEMAKRSLYLIAVEEFNSGNYRQSIKWFEALGAYSDSPQFLMRARRVIQQEETLQQAFDYSKCDKYKDARNLLCEPHMMGNAEASELLEIVQSILNLESRNAELESKCSAFRRSLVSLSTDHKEIEARRSEAVPSQTALYEVEQRLLELEKELGNTGVLAFGEKRRLRDEIVRARAKRRDLSVQIPKEIENRNATIDTLLEQNELEAEKTRAELESSKDAIAANNHELNLKKTMLKTKAE